MSNKEYVVARYEKQGKKFEILVDPEKALEYREGKQIDLDEIVQGEFIFRDVKKGLKASPEELKTVFGTDDPRTIMSIILREGEMQLTTEQRRRLLEAKKKMIINYIARSAIDPQTKKPIPPTRIEAAMNEARVSIDLYKRVEEQAMEIVKAISKILPIKLAKAIIRIHLPRDVASRTVNIITRLGEVKKKNFYSDGSAEIEIEIPAGMQGEVLSKISSVTKGEASISIIEVK